MSSPKSAHAVRKDCAIPIVFPDYLVAVTVAKSRVDLIPGVSWDNFELPGFNTKMPELGHAGVMLINGGTGLTRYYEYGRYDPQALGFTRLSIGSMKSAGASDTFQGSGRDRNGVERVVAADYSVASLSDVQMSYSQQT